MIKGRYKEIWLNRPKDIEALKMRMGTKNQNLTTLIYAEGDTRAFVKYLSSLRELCISEEIDLNTIKKITEIFLRSDQSRAIRYYRMEGFAQFLKEAMEVLQKVSSIQDYKSLIEEVLIYVGRVNFWIDEQIPWSELSSYFLERKPSRIRFSGTNQLNEFK